MRYLFPGIILRIIIGQEWSRDFISGKISMHIKGQKFWFASFPSEFKLLLYIFVNHHKPEGRFSLKVKKLTKTGAGRFNSVLRRTWSDYHQSLHHFHFTNTKQKTSTNNVMIINKTMFWITAIMCIWEMAKNETTRLINQRISSIFKSLKMVS